MSTTDPTTQKKKFMIITEVYTVWKYHLKSFIYAEMEKHVGQVTRVLLRVQS